jgi:hypothetical protein
MGIFWILCCDKHKEFVHLDKRGGLANNSNPINKEIWKTDQDRFFEIINECLSVKENLWYFVNEIYLMEKIIKFLLRHQGCNVELFGDYVYDDSYAKRRENYVEFMKCEEMAKFSPKEMEKKWNERK